VRVPLAQRLDRALTTRLGRTVASFVFLATLGFLGCSSGSGDLQDGTYAVDNGYDSALEPGTGDRCTYDVTLTCGYGQLGTKVCTCAGGVYTQCPCFPPEDWQGATTAPPCDALTARVEALRGQPCQQLTGATCVDHQPPSAGQEGCVCLPAAAPNAPPSWACGPLAAFEIPADAPSCLEYATGKEAYLKNKPCTNEWQECITRDPVEGTTNKGCVCLSTNGTLRWACASTNKWFVPE